MYLAESSKTVRDHHHQPHPGGPGTPPGWSPKGPAARSKGLCCMAAMAPLRTSRGPGAVKEHGSVPLGIGRIPSGYGPPTPTNGVRCLAGRRRCAFPGWRRSDATHPIDASCSTTGHGRPRTAPKARRIAAATSSLVARLPQPDPDRVHTATGRTRKLACVCGSVGGRSHVAALPASLRV